VPSVNNHNDLPVMNKVVKRLVDIVGSFAGIIVLSPLIAYVAIRVYFSSSGPILYSQERVGYRGRKFRIHKFRSMYTNAEMNGPRLSHDNDQRITKWGRTMRKWKLDELPQLWNVLRGEMSIVGPRPEREYFIRQLERERQPFKHLLQVKPGITSLGMIKFGYAESIKEMSERMKYDLVYIEKKSLSLDMKIMVDTVKIVLAAKGK
jgi:lipopolysaccharide/colanic/teichoic acid biosynthesis glycosyltransferase